MVDLTELRNYMKAQAESDRNMKWVQVEGVDIEDALRQAAIELGLPVKKLDYEIRESGRKGKLGLRPKKCVIVAYPSLVSEEAEAEAEEDFIVAGVEEKPVDADGRVTVRFTDEGVLLKVFPPVGRGRKVTVKEALAKIKERSVKDIDTSLVEKVVKEANEEFVKIGDFAYNPAADPVITIDITDFDMKAFISIMPPGPGGIDIDYETVESFLKNNNVIHGINEELIRNLEDFPVYGKPILVAEGTKPVNGSDARIIYNFNTDRSNVKLKEKNGRVDFKEQNLIKNVVEGQALARKVPAEQGKSGRTVTGRLLPAEDGKDVEIGIGKNVKLSEDGNTAIAEINGQVIMLGNKLNVEPIYVVNGDVNLKNGGNVIFLGTVLVKGSVTDGFKVKAAGNIEVMGNVGKSELDAEGDIIIHQGVNGKSSGFVRAGKGVWSKFIENTIVDAGEIVFATDGIINSKVDAQQKIVCQGKRATIVGGVLRAAEEIHAKTLGTVAGSETVLEVGYDPKKKERLVVISEEIEALEKELEEINLNVVTLQRLMKTKKKLPDDKQAYYDDLLEKQKDTVDRKNVLEDESLEIKEYLESLEVTGRISASSRVFPGVKLSIKNAYLEIKSEYKAVTFINEDRLVKITKYEELEEDYSQKY